LFLCSFWKMIFKIRVVIGVFLGNRLLLVIAKRGIFYRSRVGNFANRLGAFLLAWWPQPDRVCGWCRGCELNRGWFCLCICTDSVLLSGCRLFLLCERCRSGKCCRGCGCCEIRFWWFVWGGIVFVCRNTIGLLGVLGEVGVSWCCFFLMFIFFLWPKRKRTKRKSLAKNMPPLRSGIFSDMVFATLRFAHGFLRCALWLGIGGLGVDGLGV